jgi:riboflavin kinase/FMN adenylyltransferase
LHIVRGLDDLPGGPSVLALGTFDGVHLGHQEVIRAAVRCARARSEGAAAAVAVTFEPHPLEVLRPRPEPVLLTTLEERLALLAALGLDRTVVVPFDLEFSRTTAGTWLDQILAERLGARAVFVGSSHTFGHRREGTAERLVAWGEARGVSVTLVPAVRVGGEPVTSSRVRAALRDGAVEEAARLLGRRYTVHGEVVAGEGRGRTLGFPTANLRPDSARKVIPGLGVYAAVAETGGRRYAAATNVGRRPTFGGSGVSIEAHLLGYSGRLTGQPMTLEFVRRIREERAFPGPDALAAQIAHDVAEIGELLARGAAGYNIIVQEREDRANAEGAERACGRRA